MEPYIRDQRDRSTYFLPLPAPRCGAFNRTLSSKIQVDSRCETDSLQSAQHFVRLTMIGSKIHLTTSPLLRDVTASSLILSTLVFILVSALAYVVVTEIYRSKIRLRRIPGPTGLPIVGNLYQLNPDPAQTLHEWGKQYGGCYQIMLGTMPVVVFNSMQAARDVFIGQGGSLIDKPRMYTFHGVLSSVASSIGTTPWNDNTKRRRKTAATAMNRPAVTSYLPFIDDLTKDLINELWKNGQGGKIAFDPRTNVSKTITDLTLTVNYGARLPADDALLEEIIDVEDGLSRIKTPLGSAQDFIPILRYIPFNKKSEIAKEINRRRLIFLNRFSQEMEDRIEKGVDKACIQGNCLRDPEVKLDKVDLLGISMSMVCSFPWSPVDLKVDFISFATHQSCSILRSHSPVQS